MLHLVIGMCIIVATLAAIVLRPCGISEAWSALAGAALLLLGGYLRPGEVVGVLAQEANVFGFFLGVMVIAALADYAGVFDLCATLVARWAGDSAYRLYLVLSGRLRAWHRNDAVPLQ